MKFMAITNFLICFAVYISHVSKSKETFKRYLKNPITTTFECSIEMFVVLIITHIFMFMIPRCVIMLVPFGCGMSICYNIYELYKKYQ